MRLRFLLSFLIFFSGVAHPTCVPELAKIVYPRAPKMQAFDYWWSSSRFELTPKVTYLLDGGVRTLVEAQTKSNAKALSLVMNYLATFIVWNEEASNRAPATFDQAISEGKGGCQQLAILLGAIFSRAGYQARFVTYVPKGDDGHVWLEVEMKNGGSSETYVVDPSNNSYFKKMSEVAQDSANPASVEHRWYYNAKRIYYEF